MTRILEKPSHSVSQEVPGLLYIPKFHFPVHRIPPLVPILRRMYLVHTFPPYFPKINCETN